MKKSTDDLLKALENKKCKIDDFINENSESFVNDDINEFWKAAINKSGLSKSNIINRADFSYCYFYDVINGRKIPGRDKIIRLILAMGLTIDDCQKALRISGRSSLYPKVKRDSIIIYAFNNNLSTYNLAELLASAGEEILK